MISKTFVGRKNELTRVREWLKRPAGGLILITGVGGIGKTSLLRRITDECSANGGFVVDYFDLAEQPLTLINQAVHLAESLGSGNFPAFMKKLTELDTASGGVAGGGLEDEAVDACVRETEAFLTSVQKKLVRVTDTFEIALRYSLYGDNWAGGINERLKDVAGTVFVIAGRDRLGEENILDKFYPQLERSFGSGNILHLPLSGFDAVETDDFFAECDEHHVIPQEMREKLHLLTEGRPILLSLAVEWLQKELPLPILTANSLEELRQICLSDVERKKLLDSFEFELVYKVRELDNPLNIAALYMAHLDRRMDSRLLSILLETDDASAEDYMQALLGLPFVKEFIGSNPRKCTLHDEMRELVTRHAWQHMDIVGDSRSSLTRSAIENYYKPRIEVLKLKKQNLLRDARTTLLQDTQAKVDDQERWLLEAETLYYSSKLGETDAFSFFDQTFYDREDSYIRDQFLLDELKRAGLNADKVAVREADGLRRRGKVEEARRICAEVIVKENLDKADRLHAYTTLGAMDENNNPVVAEKSFLNALELAEALDDIHVQGILHNNLGRLYRSMSRLEDSIRHFNRALSLSRRIANQALVATIRNNLAWTHRMNGDLDDADVLCNLAIADNRRNGRERPLAYSYLTKADIDKDKGDLQNAEKYVRQALEIFDRLDDDDGKAQAFRTQATISRLLHRFDQALYYLEEGIRLSTNARSLPTLASMHQLYGRTIRHYATYLRNESGTIETQSIPAARSVSFKQALESLEKSIDISLRTGNRWEIARSKIEIVLIKMLGDSPYEDAELEQLLAQVWEIASALDDNLLMGYFHENRARIEQQKADFAAAGRSLGEAAYHIAKRTGLENTRAFTRFQNIILDPQLQDEQRADLALGMSRQIQKLDYKDNPKLAALMSLCDQVLNLENPGSET